MKNIKLFETYKSTLNIVESNDNTLHLVGLFGETGTRNRNGRVYNKENYGAMVEALQDQVKVGLLGELEHPASLRIDLNNVSHRIVSIHMNEDGTCTGEIQLLSTPKGQIARALVESGLPIYVSSRGVGTMDESGNVTLTKLITWDIVSTPSVVNARFDLKEGLYESIDDEVYILKEADSDDEKKDDTDDNDSTGTGNDTDDNKETKSDVEEPEKKEEDKEPEKKEEEKEPEKKKEDKESTEETNDDDDKDPETDDKDHEDEKDESYIEKLNALLNEIYGW